MLFLKVLFRNQSFFEKEKRFIDFLQYLIYYTFLRKIEYEKVSNKSLKNKRLLRDSFILDLNNHLHKNMQALTVL